MILIVLFIALTISSHVSLYVLFMFWSLNCLRTTILICLVHCQSLNTRKRLCVRWSLYIFCPIIRWMRQYETSLLISSSLPANPFFRQFLNLSRWYIWFDYLTIWPSFHAVHTTEQNLDLNSQLLSEESDTETLFFSAFSIAY